LLLSHIYILTKPWIETLREVKNERNNKIACRRSCNSRSSTDDTSSRARILIQINIEKLGEKVNMKEEKYG